MRWRPAATGQPPPRRRRERRRRPDRARGPGDPGHDRHPAGANRARQGPRLGRPVRQPGARHRAGDHPADGRWRAAPVAHRRPDPPSARRRLCRPRAPPRRLCRPGTASPPRRPSSRALAARLVRPDPEDSPVPWRDFRAAAERPRFAAVFTAHPTFALPPDGVRRARRTGQRPARRHLLRQPPPALCPRWRTSSRPPCTPSATAATRWTLLNRALLDRRPAGLAGPLVALAPRPVTLASWVGYDTDGRTDIGWWDTLRLRLTMKRLQLARAHGQVAGLPGAAALAARLAEAIGAIEAQIDACPAARTPWHKPRCSPAELVGRRDAALHLDGDAGAAVRRGHGRPERGRAAGLRGGARRAGRRTACRWRTPMCG